MRETWYVLEDGNTADPREVSIGKDGRLAHNGVPVAMRGDVPRSRGVDLDDVRKVETQKTAPPAKEEPSAPKPPEPKARQVVAEKPKTPANREMRPGGGKKYRTR